MNLRQSDSPPLAIGTRIVKVPFWHHGVVGDRSHGTICEVILDEPLPHTDRIWSQWDEIEEERAYLIEEAGREVEQAKWDLADANRRLRVARAQVESARKALREARSELRKVNG